MTRLQWFAKNAKARRFAEEYVVERRGSLRDLARELRQRFRCPHRDHVALSKAMQALLGDRYPAAGSDGIAAWFAQHRAAEALVRRWYDSAPADSRRNNGLRALLAELRREHAYPFRGPENLREFAVSRWPHVEPRAPAPAPAKAARPTGPGFELPTRTDHDVRQLERGDAFLISSVVEHGEACEPFLRAAQRWAAEDRGRRLLLHGLRYKNPTARVADEPTWDSRFDPHLFDREIRPHPRLAIMPTMIAATTNNPLPPKLTGMSGECSTIFGHPQLCFRTAPLPHRRYPKTLATTGAMSLPNYSSTLAGAAGAHHHKMGGYIVELDGDTFYQREVSWDGEKFIDYGVAYYADRIERAPRPLGCVFGDVHWEADPNAAPTFDAVFWRPDSLVQTLRPRAGVVHDVYDGRRINPHEVNDALLRARAAREGTALDELRATAEFLNRIAPMFDTLHVDESNHHAFLYRFVANRQPDPIDTELHSYLRYRLARADRERGAMPDPFVLMMQEIGVPQNVDFVGDSLMIAGIECGMHGHRGINGTRGTLKGLAQMGVKFIIGDKHSPAIWQGGYGAGVFGYNHSYNKGPSAWLESMVLIHDNGKRQFAHIINGRWQRG